MTLRTPILDDRSYDQLRRELIARIPVYAPEWTDHQPADPGITLLELFAFLGENLLYRFNQIPDATRIAFLDLVQLPRRKAEPATGMVAFGTKSAAPALLAQYTAVSAGKIVFETLDEVTALPVEARGAVRRREDPPADVEIREHVARVSAAIGRSILDVTTYRTVFGAADPAHRQGLSSSGVVMRRCPSIRRGRPGGPRTPTG